MTRTVLITGARGFIGRNLAVRLRGRDDLDVVECTRDTTDADLTAMAAAADVVFHLAGVNRPESEEEFDAGNAGFTRQLTERLRDAGRAPLVVFSSSSQAALDNPYGRSKRAAEEALRRYADESGARVAIFRLKNVFGKWSRPDYNSVVATFCHRVARDLPITVSDPAREIELVYIDDVIDAFARAADGEAAVGPDRIVKNDVPSKQIALGDLAARVRSFRAVRETLLVPDLSDEFDRKLYATYLSHVEPERWEYGLDRKADERGNLAELIKSRGFGQMFVSRTRPGVTRGNHYHHTKTEKFFVIAGEGLVRFRPVDGERLIEFTVRGEDYRVIDIPPGYTHSITNVGDGEMITLFWASELFDPEHPDTQYLPVDLQEQDRSE